MRRWLAVFLLLVVATFVAASGTDNCDEGPNGHSERSQHILCVDDCASVLVPEPPAPPPPDPMPKAVYEAKVIRPIVNLDLEPEKAPPRV
jgi:hypothetical protein